MFVANGVGVAAAVGVDAAVVGIPAAVIGVTAAAAAAVVVCV